jgi:glycosyltransferase involved in cell wall biosynthesis
VSDLVCSNPIPSRLSGATNHLDLVRRALGARLQETPRPPSVLVVQFALPLGPAVRDVAIGMGLPYVVYLRGDDVWIWPHDSPTRLASFTDVVRDAALILAVSGSILAEARRISGMPLSQGVVLQNGVDLNVFRPATAPEREHWRSDLGVDPQAFVVVCVGAALRRKGWLELLDALGRFDGSNVVLLAATIGEGDLDLEGELARRASAVRLVRRAEITAPALARFYGAADVFCLPSHGEGMSNALLEAMACGIPVVTTPVGGHPEVVTDGMEGYFVPMQSAAAIHAALDTISRNPEARRRAGQAGRRRVEAIGTPDTTGRRLGELLAAVTETALPDRPSRFDSHRAAKVTS